MNEVQGFFLDVYSPLHATFISKTKDLSNRKSVQNLRL